jgi:cytochrome P450
MLEVVLGSRSLMTLDGDAHLRDRRLLLPPFHGERVRAHRAIVRDLAEQEVGRWRAGDVVSVLPSAHRITLEVIMRAVLGIEDAGLRRRLRELMDDLSGYPVTPLRRRLPGGGTQTTVAAIGRGRGVAAMLAGLPTPAVMTYYPRFKARSAWNVSTWPFFALHDRVLALMDEQIAATRADPGLAGRSDILAMLVQARDADGYGLADADLRDELFALLLAGHETTAAAIAWGAEHLAHDPAVRAQAVRAAEEEDGAYVAALVKETLRIHPPVPVVVNRALPEPFPAGGHVVPPGTPIIVDALGLHRDPEHHPDPGRFDPARFLGAAPEPYTWLPFGGGAHRCVGAALAELEIAETLSVLLRRVELEPTGPAPAVPVRRALTLFPAHGARVRVKPRARSATTPA